MLYLQIWRLLTPFFFFGTFSFNFLFNMIFTYRYCRMLEEGSFRGRTADFVYMFIFGCITTVVIIKICIYSSCFKILICCFSMFFFVQICAWFVNLLFLGHSLTTMFVYIWARRNPYVRMNFFGLLPFRVNRTKQQQNTLCVIIKLIIPTLLFQAPYLPWVLVAFSVLLGNSVLVDILGIAIGHLYFFLEDVFPNQPGGRRLLATPRILYAQISRSLRYFSKKNTYIYI